jgi:ketosteroid isomerase-like protein
MINSMKFYMPVLLCAVTLITLMSMKTDRELVPDDLAGASTLYDSIVAMDAAWEDAYNHCKMTAMDSMTSEDLEFYHDRGGLMTSKALLLDALKQNICGKVTRHLKAGSIEVYPIHNYGAVEMGQHAFRNSQEPKATLHYAKFVHLWKREKGQWRITRVISLH